MSACPLCAAADACQVCGARIVGTECVGCATRVEAQAAYTGAVRDVIALRKDRTDLRLEVRRLQMGHLQDQQRIRNLEHDVTLLRTELAVQKERKHCTICTVTPDEDYTLGILEGAATPDVPKPVHRTLCRICVNRLQVDHTMLTGYSMNEGADGQCARCGRTADLAIVRLA